MVLATKGAATESALHLADLVNLAGKTVIDTTNPIDESQPPRDGVLRFYTAGGESHLERLQRLVPAARLVKAFNSVGAIEALAILWCIPGFRHNSWTHAFRLLQRQDCAAR